MSAASQWPRQMRAIPIGRYSGSRPPSGATFHDPAELFLMTTSPKTRAERDTFGPIDVPADKLWGAQTQRSLQNFDISGEQQPREIIRALAQVKRASAVVNHALGLQ